MNNIVKEHTVNLCGKPACMRRIRILLYLLADEYGCEMPEGIENTANMLYTYACDTFYPTEKTIHSIIREWNVWKAYLSEDSYASFVLNQLKELFSMHVATTSSSPNLRSYIGEKPGVKVLRTPPSQLSTCVCHLGKFVLNGREEK